MFITKRNGISVLFEKKKIFDAIIKAMKYGSGILIKNIAQEIADEIEDILKIKNEKTNAEPTIHDVETLVYDKLIEKNQVHTAKAYEGYRAVQEFKRNSNTTDNGILELLNKTNEDVLKENSNKNSNIASTQRDLIAGEISKDISPR